MVAFCIILILAALGTIFIVTYEDSTAGGSNGAPVVPSATPRRPKPAPGEREV